MCGISVLYTCQETTDNFLFTPQVVSAVRLSPVLLVLKILFQSVSCIHEFFLPLFLFPFPFFQVFLLSDIRHDPSANDKQMYDWVLHNGFSPIIIATKLDKIKRSQVQKQVKAIKQGLQVEKGTLVIPFSAETKQGREEIWSVIEGFLDAE